MQNYSDHEKQSVPDPEIPGVNLQLGRRLYARYGNSPGIIPMDKVSGFIGHIAQFGAGRLPLLARIQRRWAGSREGGAWPDLEWLSEFTRVRPARVSTFASPVIRTSSMDPVSTNAAATADSLHSPASPEPIGNISSASVPPHNTATVLLASSNNRSQTEAAAISSGSRRGTDHNSPVRASWSNVNGTPAVPGNKIIPSKMTTPVAGVSQRSRLLLRAGQNANQADPREISSNSAPGIHRNPPILTGLSNVNVAPDVPGTSSGRARGTAPRQSASAGRSAVSATPNISSKDETAAQEMTTFACQVDRANLASAAKPGAKDLPTARVGEVSAPLSVKRTFVEPPILRRHTGSVRPRTAGETPVAGNEARVAQKIGSQVREPMELRSVTARQGDQKLQPLSGQPGLAKPLSLAPGIERSVTRSDDQSYEHLAQTSSSSVPPVARRVDGTVAGMFPHDTLVQGQPGFLHPRPQRTIVRRKFAAVSGDFGAHLLERHSDNLITRRIDLATASRRETANAILPVVHWAPEPAFPEARATQPQVGQGHAYQTPMNGSIAVTGADLSGTPDTIVAVSHQQSLASFTPPIIQRVMSRTSDTETKLDTPAGDGSGMGSDLRVHVAPKTIPDARQAGASQETNSSTVNGTWDPRPPAASVFAVESAGAARTIQILPGPARPWLHRSASGSSRIASASNMDGPETLSLTHRSWQSPAQVGNPFGAGQRIPAPAANFERVQRFEMPSISSDIGKTGGQLPALPSAPNAAGAVGQRLPNLDINQLANRVYSLLVQRLAGERQRRGM